MGLKTVDLAVVTWAGGNIFASPYTDSGNGEDIVESEKCNLNLQYVAVLFKKKKQRPFTRTGLRTLSLSSYYGNKYIF